MGYNVRSLATLAAQAKQFFTESVPGAVVDLWANTFRVLQKVIALLDKEHELRRAYLFRQLFASTADYPWLVRMGYELGLVPLPARRATGEATIFTRPGLVVPAGLIYVRADGAEYRVRASQVAGSGQADISFESVETGSLYNSGGGTELTAQDVGLLPAGLGFTATVTSAGLGGGSDAEGVESFRARVLERKRNPPQGGSRADYSRWVKEAIGASLRQAWAVPFADDDHRAWVTFTMNGRPDLIPSESDVAAVDAYLKDPIRRPVTAKITVVAPTPRPVAVEIQGLGPDTAAVRAAIGVELQAVFLDRAEPALPGQPFVFSRSWLSEAIGRATGEGQHILALPQDDVTVYTAGQYPVLQSVSFT